MTQSSPSPACLTKFVRRVAPYAGVVLAPACQTSPHHHPYAGAHRNRPTCRNITGEGRDACPCRSDVRARRYVYTNARCHCPFHAHTTRRTNLRNHFRGGLIASWSGLITPTTIDYLCMAIPGSPDDAWVDWVYASSCTKSAGPKAKGGGSCTLSIPNSAGVYEVRLFSHNGLRRRLGTTRTFVVPLPPDTPPAAPLFAQPRTVGTWLQLFTDTDMIAEAIGVKHVLHSPRPVQIVLARDKPWENVSVSFITVLKDGDIFRMYYRCGSVNLGNLHVPPAICYVESSDGIHWGKPAQEVVHLDGVVQTNIILVEDSQGTLDVFAPFLHSNPEASPAQRFEAITMGRPSTDRATTATIASHDGLHWMKLSTRPIGNVMYWREGQVTASWDGERGTHVAYFRVHVNDSSQPGGIRRLIARIVSDNFIGWRSGVSGEAAPGSVYHDRGDFQDIDLDDTPPESLYTNSIAPYFRAPWLLVGFPSRFIFERRLVQDDPQSGISDSVFISSRDGLHFARLFMDAFLQPGDDVENWRDRSTMIPEGLLPTSPSEMSVYYSEHNGVDNVHLTRGVLRTDGFVSANGLYEGGALTTRPFTFSGSKLHLNYSTSAVGVVLVEIDGKPIQGYGMQDSLDIYGDTVSGRATWKRGVDVSSLAGTPIRLRFFLKDADLYSF